jgi:light-regulated signal transduction histidine kinase (bacteriophytochrome)
LLRRKLGATLGATEREYIDNIVAAARRMDQLLRDLRLFTEATGTSEAPACDVDANAVLASALATLKASIDESAAAITFESLPPVRIHGFQLQQLFQNLIGNAIRYRSAETPKIHIRAERADAIWTFSVRDNGIGIDPQYKEQIFGMFKRLHSYADHPGSGMGLAICERIVSRLGGRIWVESEPGRGSTFSFTIPIRETN